MEDLGTVEAGKHAHLLLVRGRPWRNIKHLRDIDTVIQNGSIVTDSPDPKAILDENDYAARQAQ